MCLDYLRARAPSLNRNSASCCSRPGQKPHYSNGQRIRLTMSRMIELTRKPRPTETRCQVCIAPGSIQSTGSRGDTHRTQGARYGHDLASHSQAVRDSSPVLRVQDTIATPNLARPEEGRTRPEESRQHLQSVSHQSYRSRSWGNVCR